MPGLLTPSPLLIAHRIPVLSATRHITENYLTKLKEWRRLSDKQYQLPLEGSKIFVRVWQQENGWEDKTLLRAFEGVVPKRGSRGSGGKGLGGAGPRKQGSNKG